MDYASAKGHVNILDYLSQSPEYSSAAISWAAGNGRMDSLQWWNNSALEKKITPWALDSASLRGHLDVLEFWKEHDWPKVYTSDAVDFASENHYFDVLDWWLQSGWELRYTSHALDSLLLQGHVPGIEWWCRQHKLSGLELKYSPEVIADLAEKNQLGVLKILDDALGGKMVIPESAMDYASMNGHTKIMDWLAARPGARYSYRAIEWAVYENQQKSLQWWCKSGSRLELKYNPGFMDYALQKASKITREFVRKNLRV